MIAQVPRIDFSPLARLGDAIYQGRAVAAQNRQADAARQDKEAADSMFLSLYGGDRHLSPMMGVDALQAPNAAPAQSSPQAMAFRMDDYLPAIRAAESGGNDSAKNPRSSALGRYQFTDATWRDLMEKVPSLGLTEDGRTDPRQQERAIRAFTGRNIASLKRAGLPVDNGSVYAMHFLGAGDGPRVLAADPQTAIDQLLGGHVIAANPHLQGMTAGDFRQWAASKAGRQAKAQATPSAPTIPLSTGEQFPFPSREQMAVLMKSPDTRKFAMGLVQARMTGNTDPLEREMKLLQMEKLRREMNAPDSSDPKISLSPLWGSDEQGNPVILQVGDDGVARRTQIPEGVTPLRPAQRIDTGTGTVLIDPVTGGNRGFIPKEVAEAEAEKQSGKTRGKLTAELPQARQKAQAAVSAIRQLKFHPGLAAAVGPIQGRVPDAIAGVINPQVADFRTRLAQAQGKAFLQAFESLKGGGQITEVEGLKAERAIARLNQAVTEEDFVRALTDFEEAITRGLAAMEQAAQGNVAPSPSSNGQTSSGLKWSVE